MTRPSDYKDEGTFALDQIKEKMEIVMKRQIESTVSQHIFKDYNYNGEEKLDKRNDARLAALKRGGYECFGFYLRDKETQQIITRKIEENEEIELVIDCTVPKEVFETD